MDEFLAQFLVEGPELAQQAAEALLTLERSPDDRQALDDAFRAFHTLKGSVGLFDLPAMARLLHRAEDLLGEMRAGRQQADAAIIGRLLAVLAQTEQWIAALETDGALPADSDAIADAMLDEPVGAPAPALREPTPPWAAALRDRLPATTPPGSYTAIRYRPASDAYFSGDDPIAIVAGVPSLVSLELGLAAAEPDAGPYDPFTCRLIIGAVSAGDPSAARTAFRFVPDQVETAPIIVAADAAPIARGRDQTARSVRVDVARIDALSALSAELIAAKTALSAAASAASTAESVRALANAMAAHAAGIDRLANRLHEGITTLRMAPVGPSLRRFPRLVREMAQGVGKSVEVIIEDGGVEADRAIIEGLGESLTHLLRNAVDHGIETPKARVAAGKPARGRIILGSHEANGRLILRIADDGQGIDPARVRRKLLERGLIDESRLQAMGDAESLDQIFAPGFSTAEAVTTLSGRGVGMDAVRAAVHALGGRIAVSSEVGRGAVVELSLPLAVSLTKVMVVADAADRWGLPLDSVLETLRLPVSGVVPIRDRYAFYWRDRAIPLTPLSALTGGERRLPAGDQRVVVVRANGQPMGLAVGRISDRLDVAMRPLSGLLAGMPGIAGTALLGDGRILMILDIDRLAQ